jgi:hypothetical protein
MKLRIVNQFGAPLCLQGADSIKIQIPYENGHVLEKSNVRIIDANEGKIALDLEDFEIQGLKEGEKQNFMAEIRFGDDVHHVLFEKGLNVRLQNDRKVIA